MNLVKIYGTLEEQLFQYAFFLSRRRSGGNVKLWGDGKTLAQALRVASDEFASLPRQRGGLLGLLGKPFEAALPEGYRIVSEPTCTEGDNLLFDGKWQSWEHVERVEDEMLAMSRLRDAAEAVSPDVLREMEACESVALHVVHPTSRQNTCTPDYYNWAVAHINSYLPEARFFIITDDEKWARRNITGCGEPVVVRSGGMSTAALIGLMAAAKHDIISNTLAAWWGAWLNRNIDKISIAPKEWSRDSDTTPDIIPLHWISIPTT